MPLIQMRVISFASVLLLADSVILAQDRNEYRDDYELTVDVAVRAVVGWELYLKEEYSGSVADGHFTDPEPDSPGNEFWSDGVYAKFDRDNNSHGETVFVIKDGKLVYAGCTGSKGQWVHTSQAFAEQSEVLTKFANDKALLISKPNKSSQTDEATIARAQVGWKLYQQKRFAGRVAGGPLHRP